MRKDEYIYLESIIDSYYDSLFAIAQRFVNSPDLAKDIVQEVIIKFWEKKRDEVIHDKIQDLLFIMVKNESLNLLRSRNNLNKHHNKYEVEEIEEPKVWNILMEEEVNTLLLEAIKQLPEQSSKIMHYVLVGNENKEIADKMNISINTVKTLKYSAIKKMRDYFSKKNVSPVIQLYLLLLMKRNEN